MVLYSADVTGRRAEPHLDNIHMQVPVRSLRYDDSCDGALIRTMADQPLPVVVTKLFVTGA